MDIILTQSETAISLISSENIELILSKKQLTAWQYLQGVPEASPQEIVNKTGIAGPTVYQILTKLLKLKKIERFGLGRGIRYRKK